MKNYKISTSELAQNKYDVVFSGNLDLENIENIKSDVIHLLDPEKEYVFNFAKINNIDLAFIQLLLVLENDEKYINVSINFEKINEHKDFLQYISSKKI